MTNLCAYCARVPRDIKASNDPISSENDVWLNKLAREVAIIVAAYKAPLFIPKLPTRHRKHCLLHKIVDNPSKYPFILYLNIT